MKKRPDAEAFLTIYYRLCVGFGLLGIFIGIWAWICGEDVGGILVIAGVGILLFSTTIAICIRFHNVFLDIRDAEFEIVRSLKAIQISNSSVNESYSSEDDSGDVETVLTEDDEALQIWKDSQILRAKAAYEAGKITEKKYIDYINKVTACKSIPNSNSKN